MDDRMSQTEDALIFPYRVQGWSAAFSAILLVLFAGLMIFLVVIEPGSFIGIRIGAPFGAMVYGSLAAVSLGLAVLLVGRHRLQKGADRTIVFGVQAVTLPESLTSPRLRTIHYGAIKKIERETISRAGMNFIRIDVDDVHLRISDFGFDRPSDFMTVYDLLKEKTGHNK